MRVDVAIIGGGAIGAAAAYFLRSHPRACRVAVIERDTSYQLASTPRASGGVRRLFSLPENIALSNYSIPFFARFDAEMAVDGERPAINFRKGGYLFIVPPAAVRVLERNFEIQKANGVQVEWLERKDLKAKFPSMTVDDLGGGVLSPDDGWLDPYGVLQGLRKKAKALGAEFVNDEVVGLDVERRRLRAIRLKSGKSIEAEAVINAAGAWAKEICAMAGWTVPIEPMRRYEHYFESAEAIEPLPYIKDVHRLAFARREKAIPAAYRTSTSREGTTSTSITTISSRLSGLRWPRASRSSSAPKKRIRCRVSMTRTSSTPHRSSDRAPESSTIFISWPAFPGMA